jgi:arylsulfatase A-like enzyme
MSVFAMVGLMTTAAPNILFFMADDTGWNNVEWHDTGEGAGMITPHAHALLKEGIELDRHYVFPVCSPSRSSFMSGRFPYHVQQINLRNCDLSQGVPADMTFISQQLKKAETPYATVHVGKWHLGMSHASLTPKGRAFDKSLVYFEGAQDHFTQRSCCDPACLAPINNTTPSRVDPSKPSPYDFWVDDGTTAGAGSMGVGVPAAHLVETAFNGYLFNDFAVRAIEEHNLSRPLFMYLAPASAHSPLQAPQRFIDMYPKDWYIDRRLYAAECSVWDEILGNVTAAMRARAGMWENSEPCGPARPAARSVLSPAAHW